MSKQKLERDDYDTVLGITAQLIWNGLAGLNEVIEARVAAGYHRQERLQEFVVMGWWYMDTCGNTGKFRNEKDTTTPGMNCIPNLPLVVTNDDFFALVRQVRGEHVRFSISSCQHDIPPATALCPWCNQGWDIHNCHDVIEVHSDAEIPIPYWKGRSLMGIKNELESEKDMVFRLRADFLVRHDRWIDRTPLPAYEGLVVNPHGCVGVEKGRFTPQIDWYYKIQEGDELHVEMWNFYHKKCWDEYKEKNERASFAAIFRKAGFQQICLTATENRYCDCEACSPWYFVDTEVGRILIGWRKRVISISWDEILSTQDSYKEKLGLKVLHLFEAEDVTKDERSIHAHGEKKAIEYLTKIRCFLSRRQKRDSSLRKKKAS